MVLRFITFGNKGDHYNKIRKKTENYEKAGKRLLNEVQKLDIFDSCQLYTDDDLKSNRKFWKKHSKFIISNQKGFGRYIWKPFLIKRNLEHLNDGDILLYLDAGCELPVENKQNLLTLISNVKTELLISSTNYQTEKKRSKRDLIKYLDCENSNIINFPQRQPGAVLYYVCKETRDFVNKWYELCSDKSYHWLDDSPSTITNYPEFKGHRHDQSIFSLLSKKYNLFGTSQIDSAVNIVRNRNG